ncbi:GIY-YIG nuclease family protein [bacterium]|nr:GIY-YIG nuclease family protein [bacterium]
MDDQSRKDLIRHYRETAQPMGIYQVANRETGAGVLGASTNLTAILNRHRAQLDSGGHPDKALQRDWDAHGADAFVFEVLDILEARDDPGYDPSDDLAELEAMWRERLAKS